MTARRFNLGGLGRPVGLLILVAVPAAYAAYKARPWTPRAVDTYPSRLASEGVTIAADPLFTDALAGKVFDKGDVVSRGILPVAVIISNNNDFLIEVEGGAIELILGEEQLTTLEPERVVQRLFSESREPSPIRNPIPIPVPRNTRQQNKDALTDFNYKFLRTRRVEPHATAGGFLYMPVPTIADLRAGLAGAKLYVPKIYRRDNGSEMMFFEIELKAAMDAAQKK
jgi:hypothetical protein